MEELPKNAYVSTCLDRRELHLILSVFSAGKPLRIGLSKRLGIGLLSDDDSPLHRHFEAKLSQASTPSEPIPCSRVSVESDAVGKALRSISDFEDFALQFHPGGSLDAYVSVSPQSEITSSESSTRLSRLLPGYALPSHVYVIRGPLVVLNTGEYDFGSMQRASANANQAKMSQRQLLVRDVFADILNTDPMHIQLQSDFFLLGGNSLLLGKLSHHIRKQSGVDVGIAELFTESTVSGIASLIDKKSGRRRAGSIRDDDIKSGKTANSSTTTFSLDYDFDQDLEYAQSRRSRSQSHPLCLLVQALPFLFFHPLKTAFTCNYEFFEPQSLLTHICRDRSSLYALKPCHVDSWKLLGTDRSARYLDCRCTVACTDCLPPRGDSIQVDRHWKIRTRHLSNVGSIALFLFLHLKAGLRWSNYYLRWWIVNQSLR